MDNLPQPFRKDAPILSAAQFNAIKHHFEGLAGMPGTGLSGYTGSLGKALKSEPEDPSFLAVLSGASNPYSWAECTTSGAVITGGRTGSDAYAVNGEAGLSGEVVRLHPNEFDMRFQRVYRGEAAPPDCRVCFRIIDEETGDPIVGATVLIKAGITGAGATLANTTTDSNGEVCTTAELADGDYYRGTVTIPSAWGMNAVFTLIGGQQSTPCDAVREFAFCQSRITMCVTDCVTAAARTGLGRAGFYSGALPGTYGLSVTSATTCPSSPLYSSGYLYYSSITSAFGYTPAGDPAAGVDGSGCYTEIFFQLRETPFTCPGRSWYWRAFTGFGTSCDTTGRYKPVCGNEAIVCGADIDVAAEMYPLDGDWIAAGLTATDPADTCNPVCEAGTDGFLTTDRQTDCSPSGLFYKTLYFTALNNDEWDMIGGFVGVPIQLDCVGPSGSSWIWRSVLFDNVAGFIQCPLGVTRQFTKSQVTLTVGPGENFVVSWVNSVPDPCPSSAVPSFSIGSMSLTGLGTCHPTFSEVVGDATGFSIDIEGEVSE